jgi:hypothetical protein
VTLFRERSRAIITIVIINHHRRRQRTIVTTTAPIICSYHHQSATLRSNQQGYNIVNSNATQQSTRLRHYYVSRLDCSTLQQGLLLLFARIIINLQCCAAINKATILLTRMLRNNQQGYDIINSFGLQYPPTRLQYYSLVRTTLHSILDSFHCVHNK